ncbi:MAG: GNAT family N-acetyltransferase [Anaerolineae bacterium]
MTITEMSAGEYNEVHTLWQVAEGVGLSRSDTKESVARFLERNPGLSFVAHDGGRTVGAVLCGHDGRRGYIHHLAVHPRYRRRGIGRALVERCLLALRQAGIDKCHLFVFNSNQEAIAFWKSIGWQHRIELSMMSHFTR